MCQGERSTPAPPALPSTIQAVIAARLEQLSPPARELVNVAAVIGRAFTFEALKQVSGLDEDTLVGRLDELWQRRIVREQGIDGYDFSHDKLREGAYAALSRARRRLLHRQVAETMERLYAPVLDAHLADLAYHFYEAGAWEQAQAYGQRAGEKAQAMYAPRAAIEQFTRALDAAHHLAGAVPSTLYLARGQAHETIGAFEHARRDYEQALEVARSLHDRGAEWKSLIALGFLWTGRDYAQAGTYYQQALELARSMDNPLILAHSLNRLGNWHLNIEQPLEALRYHQEALATFQGVNDQHGLAKTLDLLGMAHYLSGDLFQGTAYYQQAVALFQQLDDRQGLVSSLAQLTVACGCDMMGPTMLILSFGESLHYGELALKIARDIGQRSAEAFALFNLGLVLGSRGEYARALELAQAGLSIVEQIEHRQWLTYGYFGLGGLYLDLLDLPTAQQRLEQALTLAHEIGSGYWIRMASGLLALVYLAQQDVTRAESILNAALSPDAPPQTIGQWVVWYARGELALASGDPGLALEIVDQLIASTRNLSSGHGNPRLAKVRSEALAALGRAAEAEAVLQAAQETAREQGLRPLLWRICVALGKLYQTQARQAEAEQAFSTARALIEELATNVPDEHLREHFRSQATAMLPQKRSPAPNTWTHVQEKVTSTNEKGA